MSALFSADHRHRFELRRKTGLEGGVLCWVMFNPSTADAERNDPTIRRCIDFSQRFGYGEMVVVNLLSIRTPNPREAKAWLRGCPPFPGEYFRNHGILENVTAGADRVVAAWGVDGEDTFDLGRWAVENLGCDFWCLGTTKYGAPRHPLYVARSAELVRFS